MSGVVRLVHSSTLRAPAGSARPRSVFKDIVREHREFRRQLDAIDRLATLDLEGALERFLQFKVSFQSHSAAEETTLYEALRRFPGRPRAEALESIEEHHLADLVLDELSRTVLDDEEWLAKFRVARSTIERHLAEEERCMRGWKTCIDRPSRTVLAEAFHAKRRAYVQPSYAPLPAEFPMIWWS